MNSAASIKHHLQRLINRVPVVSASGTPDDLLRLMIDIRYWRNQLAAYTAKGR